MLRRCSDLNSDRNSLKPRNASKQAIKPRSHRGPKLGHLSVSVVNLARPIVRSRPFALPPVPSPRRGLVESSKGASLSLTDPHLPRTLPLLVHRTLASAGGGSDLPRLRCFCPGPASSTVNEIVPQQLLGSNPVRKLPCKRCPRLRLWSAREDLRSNYSDARPVLRRFVEARCLSCCLGASTTGTRRSIPGTLVFCWLFPSIFPPVFPHSPLLAEANVERDAEAVLVISSRAHSSDAWTRRQKAWIRTLGLSLRRSLRTSGLCPEPKQHGRGQTSAALCRSALQSRSRHSLGRLVSARTSREGTLRVLTHSNRSVQASRWSGQLRSESPMGQQQQHDDGHD